MLFNSLHFLLFFPLITVLYWVLRPKFRNWLLLLASYYFYMNWQPVYALLILFSTVTTWGGALIMERNQKREKLAFILCLIINFGILFSYKYLGWIGNELRAAMDAAGLGIEIPEFSILLPVGISFYTFQAIGYLIDVKRKKITPERNFFTYALFVSFFPQLVAGPIERASNLLPQFKRTHSFNGIKLASGLELMTFGYFMKLCIADNVAPYVDAVFNNLPYHNGNSVLLASIFFTFQIFCDFGGYSLIAIGAARCMGFRLMQNFRQPYTATSIQDFWRRWHISLTTWFTDYVYIPLGGNRVSKKRHLGNIMSTFMLSGLWHGANYTFIAWGAYNGVLLCIQAVTKKWRKSQKKHSSLIGRIAAWIVTFILVVAGWILFRANSISDGLLAFQKIATERGILYNGEGKPAIAISLLLIMVLMIIELIRERRERHKIRRKFSVRRSAVITAVLIVVILLTAQFNGGQFIYFQF